MIRLVSLMDADAADVDDLSYPAAFARLRELFYVEQLKIEGVATKSAIDERDVELLREIRGCYERLPKRADSGVHDQLILGGRDMRRVRRRAREGGRRCGEIKVRRWRAASYAARRLMRCTLSRPCYRTCSLQFERNGLL